MKVETMRKSSSLRGPRSAAALCGSIIVAATLAGSSIAQQEEHAAFVIVERTATTGPETIQQEYAKLSREILPKYGARYLARSQNNTLLEGDGGAAPCCMAILQFPSLDAVRRWYDSPENQEAAKVRQSGAKFRLIAVEGLPVR
jgi:uncharacterized protein (DUF1330 family)